MVIVEVMRGGLAAESGTASESGATARGSAAAGGCSSGSIRRLTVRGHAEYAPHGEDIVCAAASVTIYTAAGALEKLCGAPEDCIIEQEGYCEISVPAFKDSDAAYRADIIMETAYIGFKQIEASYAGFLKVYETTVS